MKFIPFRKRPPLQPAREADRVCQQSMGTGFLALIVILLVVGLFSIALVDAAYRPVFADLAKVGVAGYIGWTMPRTLHG